MRTVDRVLDMSLVEVLGFVSGALCVWLVVRENVWNFPIGIANNLVFIVLFVGSGLYADASLQVFYIAIGAYGWWAWLRGGAGGAPLVIRHQPSWAWPVVAVGVAAGTWVCWELLTRHTDSTVAGWDALTTSLSVAAQLMLNRKWVGNWVVWIVADVLYVVLYAAKGLWLTAALYAGFIALCVTGLRVWRAKARSSQPDASASSVPSRPV